MPKPIPDRWLNYKPMGKQVEGTRFVAFKVPLGENINKEVAPNNRLDIGILLENMPNLGLVIDLTNTDRYYNPKTIRDNNVQHIKLNVMGHQVPRMDVVKKFKEHVKKFLRDNIENDKLIGVHCTHGVNRTGYMICHYMISELEVSPEDALKRFSLARGHAVERQNYVQALMKMSVDAVPQVIQPFPVTQHRHIYQNKTETKESFYNKQTLHEQRQEDSILDRRSRFDRCREEKSHRVHSTNRSYISHSLDKQREQYRHIDGRITKTQDSIKDESQHRRINEEYTANNRKPSNNNQATRQRKEQDYTNWRNRPQEQHLNNVRDYANNNSVQNSRSWRQRPIDQHSNAQLKQRPTTNFQRNISDIASNSLKPTSSRQKVFRPNLVERRSTKVENTSLFSWRNPVE